MLLGQHFGITLGQIQVYWNLLVLYAQYYATGIITAIQSVIDKVGDFINKNPEFITAIGAIGKLL